VQPFSEGKSGRRQDSSTMPEEDDTAKSGMTVREAEGSSWRLEVEDNQRKLGQRAKCIVGLNCWLGRRKKYDWEYEIDQKDRRRNTGGPKRKRKKEIKIGNDFLVAENFK
jgi:hypothetical protein